MGYILSAALRAVKGEKVRAEGKLPAVVYGAGEEAVSLTLEKPAFEKLYEQAGESSLVDFELDGKSAGKVLIQTVERNPVNDRIIHVDLRRIDMNKPMTAHVELNFIGEAPAVKEFGGILMKNLEMVEVKCLPKDLVSEIDVDIAALKTLNDHIKVGDLKLPNGIEIINPTVDTLVINVTMPLTDEEIAAMEAENKDVSKIEVTGAKKEEEGATAAALGSEKKADKK